MQAHYVSVWKLKGANRLENDNGNQTATIFETQLAQAFLTDEPEPFFAHIDMGRALATQLMKGLFAPDKEGSPEDRLKAELEQTCARRREQVGAGVFAVVTGAKMVDTPDLNAKRELETFFICFDGVDKPQVRAHFSHAAISLLTAVGVSLEDRFEHQIALVGDVIYLTDGESNKPIYTFSMTAGGARLSQSGPLGSDAIRVVQDRASKLISDENLSRVGQLLSASLDPKVEKLQGFISAWTSLEIFVNKCFSAIYETKWCEIMESGAPVAARPIFERFRIVMHDKYRMNDKFLIIAAVLVPESATEDAEEFSRLKNVRDSLLHGESMADMLPIDAVQKLLMKYIRAHVDKSV